jgi:hypothetical protein
MMKTLKNNMLIILKDTLKLFSITLIIPLSFTFLTFLLMVILNISSSESFLEINETFWFNYYINGIFVNIESYRIHLMLLIFCFIISLDTNYFQKS